MNTVSEDISGCLLSLATTLGTKERSEWRLGLNSSSEVKLQVERLLSCRPIEDETLVGHPSNSTSKPRDMYFVKWKDRSYIHCSWERLEDLEAIDSTTKTKVAKFLALNNQFGASYFEFFNPEYAQAQRIIAASSADPNLSQAASIQDLEKLAAQHRESSSSQQALYLVKWRGLPYTEATWERLDDILENQFTPQLFEYLQRERRSSVLNPSLSSSSMTPSVVPFLRRYQAEAVQWMCRNRLQGIPCLLNDDPNLGKACQVLGYLQSIYSAAKPTLILASSSQLSHWTHEIEKFIPCLNTVVYVGKEKEKELIRALEFFTSSECGSRSGWKFDVLVTSFDTLNKELEYFSPFPWSTIVVADAHKLKSSGGIKYSAQLKALTCQHMIFTAHDTIAKAEDVLSLFQAGNMFVDEDTELHDALRVQVEALQTALDNAPSLAVEETWLYRRHASNLKEQLPKKVFVSITMPLSPCQLSVTRQLFELRTNALMSNNESEKLALLLELMLCCSHPFLVKASLQSIGSYEVSHDLDKFENAAKFPPLLTILNFLGKSTLKLLLYTNNIMVADALDVFLHQHNFLFERVDGLMKQGERVVTTERFSKSCYDRSVLLLQSAQGALDLSVVDAVIFFDSDTLLPLLCSHYKLGAAKDLKVVRLLCENSIEAAIGWCQGEGKEATNTSSALTNAALHDPFLRFQNTPNAVEAMLRIVAVCCFKEDFGRLEERPLDEELLSTLFGKATDRWAKYSMPSFLNFASLSENSFWSEQIGLKGDEPQPSAACTIKTRKRKSREEPDQTASESKPSKAKTEKLKSENVFEWGPRSRDKAISCLLLFGFGRSDHILKASGLVGLSVQELESFCKAYLLQCGLAASEHPDPASDSAFVADAISAAVKVRAMKDEGLLAMKPHDVLTEEKFLSRLRGGSQQSAKRSLNILGVLTKLLQIITKACQQAYAAAGKDIPDGTDIDSMVAGVTLTELVDHMNIDIRKPKFMSRFDWWNVTCNKHLLIGVFRHGFGKYDLAKADPDLIFVSKIEDSKRANCIEKSTIEQRKGEALAGEGLAGINDDDRDEADSEGVHEGDGDEEGVRGAGSEVAAIGDPFPETRYLNKLVLLLVSADVEGQGPSTGSTGIGGDARAKETTSEVTSSVTEIKNTPAQSSSSAVRSSSNSATGSARRDASKPLPTDEITLLSVLSTFLDEASVAASMASGALSSVHGICASTIKQHANGGVRGPLELVGSVVENKSELHITLNEDEITRIVTALVTLGAPLLLDALQKPTRTRGGEYLAVYDWITFLKSTGISLQPRYMRFFFETCWLPFCTSISSKKTVFLNKRVLPNPLLRPSDHSFETRGLCHIFLLRQKRLRAVHFILTELLDKFITAFSAKQTLRCGSWWESPKHDRALLEGCLAFGYMAVDAMRACIHHAFHPDNLERLSVYKTGTNEAPFPSYSALESRLLEILEHMTAHLSPMHFCKIANFSTLTAPSTDHEEL